MPLKAAVVPYFVFPRLFLHLVCTGTTTCTQAQRWTLCERGVEIYVCLILHCWVFSLFYQGFLRTFAYSTIVNVVAAITLPCCWKWLSRPIPSSLGRVSTLLLRWDLLHQFRIIRELVERSWCWDKALFFEGGAEWWCRTETELLLVDVLSPLVIPLVLVFLAYASLSSIPWQMRRKRTSSSLPGHAWWECGSLAALLVCLLLHLGVPLVLEEFWYESWLSLEEILRQIKDRILEFWDARTCTNF